MKEAKLPTIKIGEREIPLYYSALEMADIQTEIGCTAYQLNDEVFGVRQKDEDKEDAGVVFGVLEDGAKLKKLGTLIRILGNAGLEEEGQEPDLTDKWIMRKLKPGMVMIYVIALVAVIAEGNRMEATEKRSGPVDLILEEEEAKKQPGN